MALVTRTITRKMAQHGTGLSSSVAWTDMRVLPSYLSMCDRKRIDSLTNRTRAQDLAAVDCIQKRRGLRVRVQRPATVAGIAAATPALPRAYQRNVARGKVIDTACDFHCAGVHALRDDRAQ